ncbi:hypothetical protein PsyrH_07840 [Pseudomonas syringae pv. syringae HS191]|uniref:Uncharacterized protein n=2 Tax=Pseudomonas syringae TaxID=317 RepID=A0AAD0MVW8_PSESX|nr:hypothetical protein [Pseudomonas syringae]AKF50378.1 hypothetical protein PsyrH_07840 [Pseudomonas syringae pv. syringae HS191]AVX21934.1 hypothetical protein DA456_00180 [Pseudomonas syringae pv. atrofaciens]MBI6709103.1 hypothetical protein [Pseudomonas syringae]MBI6717366.1 hypothetical protein [Pseudomonas syringae]MBI6758321.1 hypothetical protein [Pseudomonas syringae]
MVDTQPNSIRKVLYANTILLYFFIFILSSKSPFLLWLAVGSLFVFLGRTLFLIYVNERFSAFATQFYAVILLTFTIISVGSSYTVSKNEFHQDAVTAVLWACLPLLLVLVGLLIIVKSRFNRETLPFKTHDGRVIVEHTSYNVQSGIIAGVATLISSIILKTFGAASTGLLVGFASTILTLYLLFHYRFAIRGLIVLMQKEKNNVPYTFANIEEIREARDKWWLSRLFKWLTSGRKKPGT